jgi:hypothetical protein
MIGGPGMGQLTPYDQYMGAHPECMNAQGQWVVTIAPQCNIPQSIMDATYSIWASDPGHQPAAVVPAAIAQTVASPQFATMPYGTSSTTTFTLDSFMAEWANGAIVSRVSMEGTDPMAEAVAHAQQYCAVENPPDCSDRARIAALYGNQVAQAYQAQAKANIVKASPAPQPSPQPPPQPPSVLQPAKGDQKSTGVRKQLFDAGPAPSPPAPGPPPVVVNPSPASQPVSTGTPLTAPGSALSQANGTVLKTADQSTDIVPGVPNGVLLLGGAAAVVLVLMTMGSK